MTTKMNNRDLPLKLIVAVKRAKDKLKERLKAVDFLQIESEDLITITISEKEIDSPFYFKISGADLEQFKDPIAFLEFKPQNDTMPSVFNQTVPAENIISWFDSWLIVVKEYYDTFLSEDILKSNQERFLKDFEILDDDADNSSFNLTQQIFLDEYLRQTIEILEELKPEKDTVTVDQIADLQEDAARIKKSITKESKRTIVIKLTKFWARAQMIGLDVIKQIFVRFLSEITVKLITGGA